MYLVAYYGGLYLMTPEGYVVLIASTILLNGLTYDTSTQNWYACDSSNLYIIDINTGMTTLVGPLIRPNIIVGIACDNDGNIYGYDLVFSDDSTLYHIDKITGHAIPIGDMGYGFLYAQDPAYDRDDDILYIAGYFNDGSPSALLTCNTQTGACTIVGNFEYGAELDAFAIPFGSPNQYPSADFTWTPLNPLPGDTVFFNASASYDPDGYLTLYEWDWNHDGVYEESHTTPIATHVWMTPGNYVVTLRVTDNGGLTTRKSKTVNVVNQAPPAPYINGPTNGTVNHPYAFSIGPITDPEGDAFYCKWDWGDGDITDWLGPYPSGQIVGASHTWILPGIYEIRAKIKDTYGAESNWSEPHIMTIVDNQPPVTPSITGSAKGKPDVSYLYRFGTTDPEDDSVSYFIDWGDGANSSWLGPYESGVQKSASHNWSQKGAYTVKIKAKDVFDSESDWESLLVTIPCSYTLHIHSFFEWLLERFPHALPLLRFLMHLEKIC
jgi:PKD repeat protein